MFSPSQQSLMRAIGAAGPLSRSELAEQTGLSKAAVTGLARSLLDRGLLRPVETVYGAGRPSIRLGIDPAGAYFLGCSVLPGGSPAVLTDLAGTVVAEAMLEGGRSAAAIGMGLARALPALMAAAGIVRAQLGGAGIAVPGYVEAGHGEAGSAGQPGLVTSTLLDWVDVPAARLIAGGLDLPVTVQNDANALALGEKLFGVAREARSFSLVALGEGIGCAHMIDGALFRGQRGGAGEVGHMTIQPGGLRCRCGKHGCADTVASLRAIAEAAAAAGLSGGLPGLERGGPDAAEILHRAGAGLGLVLANIVQMLDPGLIVLAHPDGALDGVLGAAMRAALDANVLPQMRGQARLLAIPTSPTMLARGAAGIATQMFLHSAAEDRA